MARTATSPSQDKVSTRAAVAGIGYAGEGSNIFCLVMWVGECAELRWRRSFGRFAFAAELMPTRYAHQSRFVQQSNRQMVLGTSEESDGVRSKELGVLISGRAH